VVRQVDLGDEPVRFFHGGDPGQLELLDQAVLEGGESALRAAPGLGRVGRDVLDAELGQRPADLGRVVLVDLGAGLGGVEVVRAPVGVERTRQALGRDHLQ
jgi:hypothetical protein